MTPVGGCGFLLMGVVADATNLVVPFIIPLVGYIIVALYGFGLMNKGEYGAPPPLGSSAFIATAEKEPSPVGREKRLKRMKKRKTVSLCVHFFLQG